MVIRKKGCKVPGKSIEQIRAEANFIRKFFGLKQKRVDMVKLIEFILPVFSPEFAYVVLPKEIMGDDEARTYPDKQLLEIRADVYDALTDGDRRAQFTLAHELGHLIMHHGIDKSVRFARNPTGHKIYEDSEWQADTFAAEFLMPYETAIQCEDADEIYEEFGVSYAAAQLRYKKLH